MLRDATAPAAFADGILLNCPSCHETLGADRSAMRLRVCPSCGFHIPIRAGERIASLADPGTFTEFDRLLASRDPIGFADPEPYADRLQAAQADRGMADAVTTGFAELHHTRIVLVVLDFAFMGGSMGVVVGEKVARAADKAREERIPLVAVVASGGARMQEGLFSLFQMAKTAAAYGRLQAAGIPTITVLTNPTTGGVIASFASLADIIVGEPGALAGFAGPRVAEAAMGKPLPPGSHRVEFLRDHGLIDAVVDRRRLRSYLGNALYLLDHPNNRVGTERKAPLRVRPHEDASPAWDRVKTARGERRPTMIDLLSRMADVWVELHGDRVSGEDAAVVAGLAEIDGQAVVVVGFERGHAEDAERRRQGRPVPSGYRKAQRALDLAARLGLPVVTLVDTPGAWPGIDSEEGNLAGEIARTMMTMSGLPVPTVAALIGEAGSGGALALAIADRTVMLEGAVFPVIAPEGAAAILYRDAERAPEIAEKLRLRASDVLEDGFVDRVVPEPGGGAEADHDATALALKECIFGQMRDLQRMDQRKRLAAREKRFRQIGQGSVDRLKSLPR